MIDAEENIENAVSEGTETPAAPARPSILSDEMKKKRGADSLTLATRAILQWKMIQSFAIANVAWIVFASLLYFFDAEANFWPISGIIFCFIGLMFMSHVFGICMYLSQKAIVLYLIKESNALPDPETMKKMGLGANLFWLVLMYLFTKYCFDLTYETLNSLI